jgi:hypothetical protein
MGDWDGERGERRSVLGRVDWSCWLAVVGLLFVTVVSFVVKFALMGIIAVIVAILLVAFDSWVNRPHGGRATRAAAQQPYEDDDDWSEVRPSTAARPVAQPQRQAPPPQTRQAGRQAPNFQGARPGPAPQARPNAVPPRPAVGPAGAPGRPGQPGHPGPGQPARPNQPPPGAQPGQPTRVNQAQPPRAPYPPAPPQPARGADPDFRART